MLVAAGTNIYSVKCQLEDAARYAGLLLAPVEGFGLTQKNSLLFLLAHFWRFFVSSSKFNKFQKIQKYKTNTKNLKNFYKKYQSIKKLQKLSSPIRCRILGGTLSLTEDGGRSRKSFCLI